MTIATTPALSRIHAGAAFRHSIRAYPGGAADRCQGGVHNGGQRARALKKCEQ
jgi:hypothetical protein